MKIVDSCWYSALQKYENQWNTQVFAQIAYNHYIEYKSKGLSDILKSHGAFLLPTPEGGYISVNPEIAPHKNGVSPTGRYFIFYADPVHGSCTFIIEQDEQCNWVSDVTPPWIKKILEWIGCEIVKNNDLK